MPIYEYECEECKNVFEAILSSSAQSKDVACPQCGSSRITKIISAGSHRLNSGAGLPSVPSGKSCGGNSGFS